MQRDNWLPVTEPLTSLFFYLLTLHRPGNSLKESRAVNQQDLCQCIPGSLRKKAAHKSPSTKSSGMLRVASEVLGLDRGAGNGKSPEERHSEAVARASECASKNDWLLVSRVVPSDAKPSVKAVSD